MNRLKQLISFSLVFILFFSFSFFNFNAVFANVDTLNSQIQGKKNEIQKIEDEQAELEEKINAAHAHQETLVEQIENIENAITLTENEIKKTELEIEKISLEINQTVQEITLTDDQILNQKDLLREYIKVMQQYDSKSPLEMILGNESLSEVLDQIEYLETLEGQSQQTLDDIQELKAELEWQKQVLEAKNDKQKTLRDDLSSKKNVLTDEKGAKDRLLEETQLEEEKFKELLEQSKQEYSQAQSDIKSLEAEVQKQLSKKEVQDKKPDDYTEFSSSTQLSWPVYPKRGISAYFQDPSYKDYFGVGHNAIDIPAPQGSTIYAPADGYVVKYRNAGYGYSYLVVHHGGGLSTVYGHIPASLVSAGEFVKRGQPIALVGGTPGTPGAGWMTTGAHLHFETRINGSPVNPMQFLPSL